MIIQGMKVMSGEIEKEILRILEEAIKREQAAYKLYNRGAELSDDRKIKGVFLMLAEEEQGHEQTLKHVYHDYKKQLGLKVLKEDEE